MDVAEQVRNGECSAAPPILCTHMKPKSRDNLIYLAVGLSIAGFVVARFFYAESHGNVIGKLSTLPSAQ